MDRKSRTNDGLAAKDASAPVQGSSKKHFDTFETRFFEQGDEAPPVETERFDDLDEGNQRKRLVPSRQFILGVAVGSTCLAILGCVALWRSGRKPAPTAATVVAQQVLASPTAPAPPAPPAASPPQTPSADETAPAEPAARAHANAAEMRSQCEKAANGRGKGTLGEILSSCAEAFAADPSAADIAVLLAKAEFDRGRTAQAYEWGKKAVAADPNTADAYVYIGGAEQNAGHSKAAKEAYKRYLQLAPAGRYAPDLRAIVGSL